MTNPQNRSSGNKTARGLRQRPSGWPVGSFDSYTDAQAAVDKLSDMEFPVSQLTIVGVDLMEVERVTGRLTWGRVIGGGALSGAWLGVFFGLLLSILGLGFWTPMLLGVVMGAIFGIVLAVVPYAFSQGRRDFVSSTEIVAGRYDVLCEPEHAVQARDEIARMGTARGGRQVGTPGQGE